MKKCRQKAANEARKFIPDGATILTHGHSRAVVEVVKVRFHSLCVLKHFKFLFFKQASEEGKLKRLYVTKMTNGDGTMVELIQDLKERGVECYEILTRSVAYVMEVTYILMCDKKKTELI